MLARLGEGKAGALRRTGGFGAGRAAELLSICYAERFSGYRVAVTSSRETPLCADTARRIAMRVPRRTAW